MLFPQSHFVRNAKEIDRSSLKKTEAFIFYKIVLTTRDNGEKFQKFRKKRIENFKILRV